jgi:O-antigen/teichoic acid export membrane protein
MCSLAVIEKKDGVSAGKPFGFVSSVFYSAIATVTRAASGLIISKAVATAIGPAGLATVGQFQNFASIFTTFSTAGVSTGVVRYVAEFREDSERRRSVIGTAFWAMLFSTGSIAILIALLRKQLAFWILENRSYGGLLATFAATLCLTFLSQLILSILNGYKEIGRLTFLNITGSVLGAVFTFFLATRYGVTGALYSLVLTPVAVFILTAGWAFGGHWIALREFTRKFNSSQFSSLMHYTVMALVSAVAVPVSLILVRTYLTRIFSAEAAGYWQAVWRISDTYLMVVTTAMSIYYLPRLAELKDEGRLQREIFHVSSIAMPVVIASAACIYLLRDFILRILFASTFFPARDLFALQLVGDCLKIASWILSYLMVARAMTRLFIITEVVFDGLYFLFTVGLTRVFHLRGVTYAFALTYLLYLIVMIVVFRRTLFRRHAGEEIAE